MEGIHIPVANDDNLYTFEPIVNYNWPSENLKIESKSKNACKSGYQLTKAVMPMKGRWGI